MIYNFQFEIAAILLMCLVLYDYNNKMRIYRLDSRLFKIVIYFSILESIANFTSSILIYHGTSVPVWINELTAVIFFVLQATKIYTLAAFSCAYMNPHFSVWTKGFFLITLTYAVNLVLSLTTPFTGFFFYFNEAGVYSQGFGSDMGYYFYLINVCWCLLYVIAHRKRLLLKDKKVAGVVAFFVAIGVLIQFYNRTILTIGMSMAFAILYLYMTLENPNDYQDRLTLCTNAYGFKLFIDNKSKGKKPYTVVLINIKKFRYINSIYGTEAGDFLLQQLVLYLEGQFNKQVVFRIHNDLFAVVINLPQDKAIAAGKLIEKRFQGEWDIPDGNKIHMEAAIILCEYPTYFRNHTEFLKLSNHMLQKTKEIHDRGLLTADQQTADKCSRQDFVEKIIGQAMENHSLKVYYQPIVDSDTGKVVSLEALSRLFDENAGFIPPDEFIAVAEATGQIIPLGFYVLEEVCNFAEKHILHNSENTIENIHVNLSSLQCVYSKLGNRFQEIMEKHRIPSDMIHFELTENTMLESPEIIKETMMKLIEKGSSFALDDYGTGYSNISYLIQFPFEKIKFDKNMIWAYFKNDEAHIIMENEFHILHTLKKGIIVEGIETEEQYQEMKKKGIHLFQGYYFSPALPEEECVEFLRTFPKRR